MEEKGIEDKESSKSEFYLCKNLSTQPIPLPHPHTVATMSDSGKYLAFSSGTFAMLFIVSF